MKKVGYCWLVIVLLLMLSGCFNRKPQYGYDDFNHINHWDQLADLTAEKTIIYYYSPFCDICIRLEEPVTAMLAQIESEVDVYLIDDGMIYEQGEPSFELYGVPALIILINGAFDELIRGSVPVTKYLEQEVESLSD